MNNCQLVSYLDNDAARSSLLRGVGATAAAEQIVDLATGLEMDLQSRLCYARVPTASNIADEPSRLVFDTMRAVGAEFFDVPWGKVDKALQRVQPEERG